MGNVEERLNDAKHITTFPKRVMAFQGWKLLWRAIFMKKVIRCINPTCNHGVGNILIILDDEDIYIRHRNHAGNYWEKITVRIPGIQNIFKHAAIVQSFASRGIRQKKQLSLIENKIFVRCRNSSCNRLNCIEIGVPGLEIDFKNSATRSKDLPPGYHLDFRPATKVLV